MTEDQEVTLAVWEGRIPIEFRLIVSEQRASQTAQSCYLLVPRVSYLPLLNSRLRRHFASSLISGNLLEQQIWFDFEDEPLKWHWPIGVLYDLLANESLPWSLTVHFTNYPSDKLLQCKSTEQVEQQLFQSIKEADHLKHRKNLAGEMQKKYHKQLWQGLENDRFEQFWSINRKFMDNSPDDPIRNVPFRLYHKASIDGSVGMVYLQRLCKPTKNSGERETLGDLLKDLSEEINQSIKDFNSDDWRIVSHGIDLPPETPMLWCCVNFAYPDNFVHLCLLPRTVKN